MTIGLTKQLVENLKKGEWTTKFKVTNQGQTTYELVDCEFVNGKLDLYFGWNEGLLDAVKNRLNPRKWSPEKKCWTIDLSERNLFQLQCLQGKKYRQCDPYKHWSTEPSLELKQKILKYATPKVKAVDPTYEVYNHQVQMTADMLHYKRYLNGGEMGTGKTFAAFMAAEMCNFYTDPNSFWWIGPAPAISAVRLDAIKWGLEAIPKFFTFQGLVKHVRDPDTKPPRIFVMDESSNLANPKTDRSCAAADTCEMMRRAYGWDCLIVAMTGTATPKRPTNIWHQAEILQPGFLTEGNTFAFEDRLAVVLKDPDQGYRKEYKWRVSTEMCDVCGENKHHVNHIKEDARRAVREGVSGQIQTFEIHAFKPGRDEVTHVGTRLKGLMRAYKKKECLDLPDKRFHLLQAPATQQMMNMAKQIVATTERGADALIKLRTLADGFMYKKIKGTEWEPCTACDENGEVIIDPLTEERNVCGTCHGSKRVYVEERITEFLGSPKYEVFEQLLGTHSEVGRFVTYAAFTGSVDHCKAHAQKNGWDVFRADGTRWAWYSDPKNPDVPEDMTREAMLARFQNKFYDRRVCFVGQPGSGGVGVTLHLSPSVFFFSNDFNPYNRFQGVERVHRIGMDLERGGNVYDVICLPSDRKVISSLLQSKQLSDKTESKVTISIDELRRMYGV